MKKNHVKWIAIATGLLATQGALAAAVTGSSQASPTVERANSDKMFNFRIAPLALATGGIGAHADIGVGESMTLGPTFSYMRASAGIEGLAETKVGVYEIGARANFYLTGKRFSDGLLIGPYLSYMPATVSQTFGSEESSGSASGISTGAVASYQWVWKNGLNVNVGAGLGYYSLPQETTVTASNGSGTSTVSVPSFTGVLPNIELTMGYVF